MTEHEVDADEVFAVLDEARYRVADILERKQGRGMSADLVVVDETTNVATGLLDGSTASYVDDAAFDGRSISQGSKPRLRRKPENEIVLEGITYLRSLPQGYAKKVHGGSMGNAGEPDVDACVHGRAVKLEAKAGSNKPSKIQTAALRRWAAAGALVGWFTTTQHIVELLDHLEDQDYITDLSAPGCAKPCHREAA